MTVESPTIVIENENTRRSWSVTDDGGSKNSNSAVYVTILRDPAYVHESFYMRYLGELLNSH